MFSDWSLLIMKTNKPIYIYILKTHLVYKPLVNVRPPNTNFPIQAYIQTIYVRNMKYKQYPN